MADQNSSMDAMAPQTALQTDNGTPVLESKKKQGGRAWVKITKQAWEYSDEELRCSKMFTVLKESCPDAGENDLLQLTRENIGAQWELKKRRDIGGLIKEIFEKVGHGNQIVISRNGKFEVLTNTSVAPKKGSYSDNPPKAPGAGITIAKRKDESTSTSSEDTVVPPSTPSV